MAIDYGGVDISLPPVSGVAIAQYRGVTLGATGIAVTGGATAVLTGVTQEAITAAEATAGKRANTRVSGITKAVSSGVIVPGAFCSPAAAGAIATMAADTNAICGICLAEANTANNDIFPMLIVQSRRS